MATLLLLTYTSEVSVMAYTPSNWANGDVITAGKLNNIETGIKMAVDAIMEVQNNVGIMNNKLDTSNTNFAKIEETLNILLASVHKNTQAIETLNNVLPQMQSSLSSTMEKLDTLRLQSAMPILITPETINAAINNPGKDIVVSIPADTPLTGAVKSISAQTVFMTEANVESSRLAITATGDCIMSNITSSGTLEKSVANAAFSVNGVSDVVRITDSNLNQNGYNSIEIGLNSGTPKNVIIEKIHFSGKLSNNAILIFNTADEAIVTITDCIFDDCSNPVRLSNKDNVRMTLNIVNCEFKKWDSNPEYAGCILLQDYTSKTEADADTADRFSADKIKINFINCTGPNGPIKYTEEDLPQLCGSKLADKQLIYLYRNATKANMEYTGKEAHWPTLSFA